MSNVIALANYRLPTAPSYAPRSPYIPPPTNPLMPWREDPLGAVALMVTMTILIFATGIATFL